MPADGRAGGDIICNRIYIPGRKLLQDGILKVSSAVETLETEGK